MKKLFTIYTENKNKKGIIKLINNTFDGFTIYEGSGFWQGIKEKSLIIEVIGKAKDKNKIKNLALAIKKLNNQQAVLFKIQAVNSQLV